MAEPQGAAPAPSPRSSNIPKISFGQVIDVPNTVSTGWTVRGMDLYTGRVALSKRDGEKVSTRSISLDEYEQAQEKLNAASGQAKPPELNFRLRQQLRGEGVTARVKEYDGKTDTVLVDAVVDDRPVTKWVKRETVEKMAQKPTEEATEALSREILGDEDKSKKKRSSKNGEQTTGVSDVGDDKEDEDEEKTKEILEKEPSVEETREAMREERLKLITIAALTEDVRSGTIQKEVLDEARADIDDRIVQLQDRDKKTLSYAEKTELTKLQDSKKQLKVISQYVDKKVELDNTSNQLAEAKASGNTKRVSELNIKSTKLQGGVSSLQADAIKASGKIEVSLPSISTSGEIRATIPGSTSQQTEVSARVPSSGPTLSVTASGGTSAPSTAIAVGAALSSTSPGNLVVQAQSAVTSLDSVIGKRETGLKDIKAQITAIGNQYTELATQREQAVQRGDQGMIVQLDNGLAALGDKRVNLQKQQLATTVDISTAKNKRNNIQTLANNVSTAGDDAPPELVEKLRSAIPEGFQLIIDADLEKPTVAIPPPPRSFTATIPRRAPQRKAVGAGRIRDRLTGRGVPLQTASAAALAGDSGRTSGDYSEDAGTDAREQALSYQGGSGRIQQAPSYTSAPSTSSDEGEDDEDTFQGGLKSQQDMRALEQEQTEARESLLPDSGLKQTTTEQEGPFQEASPQQAGAPSPRETGRATDLASSRFRDSAQGARQKGAQEGFKALQSKQGTLAGSVGGDSSNTQGLRRLKKIYDAAKVGSGITVIGLIVTILVMNIQMVNKVFPKSKIIPTQSMIEDFVTLWVDINLLFISLIPFFLLIILAVIVMIAGAAGGYITGLFS